MPKFRHNDDTTVLINYLGEVMPGQLVTYTEINKLIGRDVQRDARHVLQSARDNLEKQTVLEERRCFEVVTNVGIKCLQDNEITQVGKSYTRRVHNASRKGVRKLQCVQNYADMSNEERISHNSAMSLLGVFFEVTRPKSVKQFERCVAKVQKVLPLAETLKVFQEQS